MNSERLFVPVVWFALICWFALIYYQPYAIVLPLIIGGIVEAFKTHEPPEKPVDSPEE